MTTRPFIHDDFLLQSGQAHALYHDYARDLPIIDYHCHLPPSEIAEDKRYADMSEIWLGGDHYKWRAMRSNGVAERYCTGDAPAREKFDQWAATMPHLLRNPLYHWTHLELARYFGISDLLSPKTADAIWEAGNARLADPDFSARSLMTRSKVVVVCTTDDPIDTLAHHQAIAADPSFDVQVLPTWRPDKGMAVETAAPFNAWVEALSAASDMEIGDYAAYVSALRQRHDFFHTVGCRLSDHGVETLYAADYTEGEIVRIFAKIRGGAELDADEVLAFKSAMLVLFGEMDAEKDWTQQYHYGALRNNNTAMFEQAGADIGFDSIADVEVGRPLSRLLDRLNRNGTLPRTILYNLNPRDNELLVAMCGNFQDGSIAGKLQHGSGWWFLDQMDGMQRQMESLSQLGLLSRFVGMLTDSRSFLSYTRHEYFRRILCNMLGNDMVNGIIPDDLAMVGAMVERISYHNAAGYFGFDLPSL
ncbi:MAG: glucuronate isomerase [Verrucomicrobia bacterium]|jgi:glucuronate isomerase|nr:glucuronate isomerase [Verrucomicrobiota bacterium]MBT7068959.1 glucuronate isomerase [Verrucomicrobiota bacterium]MBT7700729.1 glucuronate isomerase [Verrucomicrobiota bacterium]